MRCPADRTTAAVGSTKDVMSHNPLEWLYDRFSRYIEDRRREPRHDVLTALATTTFPERRAARGHRRRPRRRQRLRRRAGDDGAAARHRPAAHRRAPRPAAAAAGTA